MCLAVPGQITTIVDEDNQTARAELSGVTVEVNLSCVLSENQTASDLLGSWVLIHVGFAMSLIDEDEAHKTLELLAQMGELQAEQEDMLHSTGV